jgi:hypothetical protein
MFGKKALISAITGILIASGAQAATLSNTLRLYTSDRGNSHYALSYDLEYGDFQVQNDGSGILKSKAYYDRDSSTGFEFKLVFDLSSRNRDGSLSFKVDEGVFRGFGQFSGFDMKTDGYRSDGTRPDVLTAKVNDRNYAEKLSGNLWFRSNCTTCNSRRGTTNLRTYTSINEVMAPPVSPVPLPAPAFMLLSGLFGLFAVRRKRAVQKVKT